MINLRRSHRFFLLFGVAIFLVAMPGVSAEDMRQPTTEPAGFDKWSLWDNGLHLRGANMYQGEKSFDPETEWPWHPHLKKSDLISLKKSGANVVVFSVPGPFNVRSPWGPNPDSIYALDTHVKWAKEVDLFVVLGIRTGPGRSEEDITGLESKKRINTVFTDAAVQRHYLDMWRFLAERYRDFDHVVGYDPLLEPNAKYPGTNEIITFRYQWRSFAQSLIYAIREIDPNIPILISPDQFGAPEALKTWRPLLGKRLVCTIHQYIPREYTHKCAKEADIDKLNDAYKAIDKWKKKWGERSHPVAVMEYGVKQTQKEGAAFMQKQFKLLEDRDINNAVWIWEVEDPEYNNETCKECIAFDFRRNPTLCKAIVEYWRTAGTSASK